MATSNGKMVNKTAYCLLAFFLGGLGVHHFYAGKTAYGILSIVFAWAGVPLIVSVVNLIAGLCTRADNAGNMII